jgi:glycerol-3-phosphate cytidylyltransferase
MALEERMSPYGVEVVYFPYTVHTSSSHLRALIAAARPA